MAGVGVGALVISALGGAIDAGLLSSLGTVAAAGVAMFGIGAFRLPGWARLRRLQMDQVAARVALVASSPPRIDRP